MRYFITVLLLCCALSAAAKQPERGYRGFVEWSSSIRSYASSSVGFTDKDNISYLTGLSVTNGYQLSPMWFVGAGISFEAETSGYDYILPIFIEGRADFKFGKITPFADLRVGYGLNYSNIYLSPTVGYRFNWGRKLGVNVGVGATLTRWKFARFKLVETSDDTWIYEQTSNSRRLLGFFSFRVGIDF